jgi:hypothetical protein
MVDLVDQSEGVWLVDNMLEVADVIEVDIQQPDTLMYRRELNLMGVNRSLRRKIRVR